MYTNVIVALGVGIMMISNEIALIAGRFVYGFGVGILSVFVPKFSKSYQLMS